MDFLPAGFSTAASPMTHKDKKLPSQRRSKYVELLCDITTITLFFAIAQILRNHHSSIKQDSVKFILQEYQKIINEHVSLQQASWIRHHGWSRTPSKDSSSQDMTIPMPKDNNSSNNEGPVRQDQYQWIDLSPEVDNFPDLSLDMFDDIEWDHEDDANGYLDKLTRMCKAPKALRKPSLFHFKQCWDYVSHTIDHPRCTTRLDSRVNCSGDRNTSLRFHDNSAKDTGSMSSSKWHARGVEVIKEHFQPDTVNIIIIGAGPVGLALANALAELQLADPTSPWHTDYTGTRARPNIRVLLFENRLDTVGTSKVKIPGRKKEYRRDWGTDISYGHLIEYGTFDPRVVKFMKTIRAPKSNISLLIKVMETLFLLSNRDNAKVVKMLYDDFRKYGEVLRNVQNAIVFDATGHRLNTLKRPTISNEMIANTKSSVVEYAPDSWWTLRRMTHTRFVNQEDLDFLKANDEPFTVATFDTMGEGTISYPVFPNTNISYKMDFMKILGLSYRDEFWEEFKSTLPPITQPICLNSDSEMGKPRPWCQPHLYCDALDDYRHDMFMLLLEHSPGDDMRGVGSVGLYSNLTPSQATELQALMKAHSKIKDSNVNGIPILDIPGSEILKRKKIFQENNLDQVLLATMRSELLSLGQKKAGRKAEASFDLDDAYAGKISTFEYNPYMYIEPIYFNSFFGDTPILRIGDSLMTGDATAATGLTMHLMIIGRLKCKLLGPKDGEEEDECVNL